MEELTSEQWLRIGHLRFEKCDFREAQVAFERAFELSKLESNPRSQGETIMGLVRTAGEALDKEMIAFCRYEIEKLLQEHPKEAPAVVWYGLAASAIFEGDWVLSEKYLRQYLTRLKKEKDRPDEYVQKGMARGLAMIANTYIQKGKLNRARMIADGILSRYESLKIRSINGVAYLILGTCYEINSEFSRALHYYQKAHESFLEEHNWYHHLYVLFAYAKVFRKQKKLNQASWYLDLIEKAARGPEFARLRREMNTERNLIDDEAVDLLIDGQNALLQSKDLGEVSLRKQYVLLDILRVLSESSEADDDTIKGVSKAEIIQKVWKEKYRPEAHDNKLYYNINRLRKLIEPNASKPKYLLNWKEGYRFAPGLKVQYVEGQNDFRIKNGEEK